MKAYPRKLWEELTVVEIEKKNNTLIVTIGADDPLMLEKYVAKKLAIDTARKQNYKKLAGVGDIRLFGQNALALRKFYYEKS